mgnify:CR=1 FL=1
MIIMIKQGNKKEKEKKKKTENCKFAPSVQSKPPKKQRKEERKKERKKEPAAHTATIFHGSLFEYTIFIHSFLPSLLP